MKLTITDIKLMEVLNKIANSDKYSFSVRMTAGSAALAIGSRKDYTTAQQLLQRIRK